MAPPTLYQSSKALGTKWMQNVVNCEMISPAIHLDASTVDYNNRTRCNHSSTSGRSRHHGGFPASSSL